MSAFNLKVTNKIIKQINNLQFFNYLLSKTNLKEIWIIQ